MCCVDVSSLQQPDGSFVGDVWGEVDTRFSYVALNALMVLGHMELIDVNKAVEFIARCRNFDGGFGAVPGKPHTLTPFISSDAESIWCM